MSQDQRDPITCHVLDTITGTPAANLHCTLIRLSLHPAAYKGSPNVVHAKDVKDKPSNQYIAVTNADGRVTNWHGAPSLAEILDQYPDGMTTEWSVTFDVKPWYMKQKMEYFWSEIEVKFLVKKGERHIHVPVLLGPYSYTTYRGS